MQVAEAAQGWRQDLLVSADAVGLPVLLRVMLREHFMHIGCIDCIGCL